MLLITHVIIGGEQTLQEGSLFRFYFNLKCPQSHTSKYQLHTIFYYKCVSAKSAQGTSPKRPVANTSIRNYNIGPAYFRTTLLTSWYIFNHHISYQYYFIILMYVQHAHYYLGKEAHHDEGVLESLAHLFRLFSETQQRSNHF